jgi:SAM-dependent methyltransferase
MSNSPEDLIRAGYGAVARAGLSSEQDGVRAVAEAFGYTPEQLSSVPADANLGLSCGNPTAFASLRPGETVVDLGCGGGLDVFLAARKVGPQGRVIGIDMTEDMIALARRNASKYDPPLSNVQFYLTPIDRLPLPNSTVDCVISNCVINLVPDKPAVFREVSRVLKPGGRLAVSDIALKRPLPPELRDNLVALVGCVAGAVPIAEYPQGLLEAGFAQVAVADTGADLTAYALADDQAVCCPPAMSGALPMIESACGAVNENAPGLHSRLADLLRRFDVNAYAASVRVFAVKA